MSNFNELFELLGRVKPGVDTRDTTPETPLVALGIDSIDLLNILMEIEVVVGVKIPLETFVERQLETLEDLRQMLAALRVHAPTDAV